MNKTKSGPAVGSTAWLGEWIPVHSHTFWYRFGKLVNPKTRYEWQIPFGFGWIFDTYKWFFEDINLGPERTDIPGIGWQSQYRKRLLFFQRWVDPVVLPVARLLCALVNYICPSISEDVRDRLPRIPPREVLEHSSHLPVIRSPSTGLSLWLNRRAVWQFWMRGVIENPETKPGCVPSGLLDAFVASLKTRSDELSRDCIHDDGTPDMAVLAARLAVGHVMEAAQDALKSQASNDSSSAIGPSAETQSKKENVKG